MAKHKPGPGKLGRYLRIDYRTLNYEGVDLPEAAVSSYMWSFEVGGCWQTNIQIGKQLTLSPATISRRVQRIYRHGWFYLYLNGRYRHVWVVSHPAVRESRTLQLHTGGQEIPKAMLRHGTSDRREVLVRVSLLRNVMSKAGVLVVKVMDMLVTLTNIARQIAEMLYF